MNIDYLEKIIDLAKEQFNIDIKKTQRSHLVIPKPQEKINVDRFWGRELLLFTK